MLYVGTAVSVIIGCLFVWRSNRHLNIAYELSIQLEREQKLRKFPADYHDRLKKEEWHMFVCLSYIGIGLVFIIVPFSILGVNWYFGK